MPDQYSPDRARDRGALLRAPAVQALLIQCASFPLVLLSMVILDAMTGMQITVVVAAMLQGAIAAVLSYWRRLAFWWLAIQFLFPIALVVMRTFNLPSFVYLLLFVFLLALYWSTFRTQVPFYPSGPATWKAVAGLLPQDRPIRFVDIGSGLGGLILSLAGRRPDSSFTGVEVAPLPWLVSMLRSRIGSTGARFTRGDYRDLDFAQCDVVFAYLSPAAMPALWGKARAEMRSGSLLLSYEFPIPGVKSHIIVKPDSSDVVLYGWRM